MFSYTQIRKWIGNACQSIKTDFLLLPSKHGDRDGRVTSTMNETWYLERIKFYLHQYEPKLSVHFSMSREWYDLSVDGIPINLKLTCGGTDNAFNKASIEYTISGKIPEIKKTTYNDWFYRLKNEFSNMNDQRDFHKEYHYLAIDKMNGKHCFKSIIDINSFRSNPSNILQIYWKSEFELNDDKKSIRHLKLKDKREKLFDILKVVQSSLKQDYESKRDFIDFSIDNFEKSKRRKLVK